MTVWQDVIGQPAAVEELQNAVLDPRAMTHAWLITGPPGSGRSIAARAFAAALQCEEGGCGECDQCRTTLRGSHPDVTLVTTDKVTIAIKEVRELIGAAARTPSSGRYRVIIIEDADRMVERTTNVLLKAIEEPPPQTVWILCAPSVQDVLPTIRSRCRLVTLRIPPAADVAELLARRDGIAPEVALAAAQAAGSHVGVARRLATDPEARARRSKILEVAVRVRGVGDAVLAAKDLVDVSKAVADAATQDRDAAERAELLRALGIPDGEAVPPKLRSQVKNLEDEQKRRATRQQRDALDGALLDLLSCYRDVLVLQLRADVDLINGLTPSDAAVVQSLAADSTPEQTIRRMDAIAVARTRLAANVPPLLALEAMCIALRPQG